MINRKRLVYIVAVIRIQKKFYLLKRLENFIYFRQALIKVV